MSADAGVRRLVRLAECPGRQRPSHGVGSCTVSTLRTVTARLTVKGFSHVCIRVSAMERALDFYGEMLGFDVVFDVELSGPSLEQVTGEPGARGRMVGGLVGGTSIELLEITSQVTPASAATGPALGYTNISLAVDDLEAAHEAMAAAGTDPEPIVDIGGVRMFFISDPDGTPIEIIQYPNGAITSAQLWRRP
jgi:glyoxylase I family protein